VFIDQNEAGDYESGLRTGRELVVPCGKCLVYDNDYGIECLGVQTPSCAKGKIKQHSYIYRLVSGVFVRHNKAHFKSTKHTGLIHA
jgi:hypothetical protein